MYLTGTKTPFSVLFYSFFCKLAIANCPPFFPANCQLFFPANYARLLPFCAIFVRLKTIKPKTFKMKRFATRFTMLFLLFIGISSLHAQEIRNSSGSSTGRIDNDGTIRNSSGSSVGRIDNDGTIRNGSGSSIGRIDNDGTIRNGSGSSVGRLDTDGTVRNESGSSIGKIDSDGTIRNSSGSSIGSANGIKKSWAAVVFFFFIFN